MFYFKFFSVLIINGSTILVSKQKNWKRETLSYVGYLLLKTSVFFLFFRVNMYVRKRCLSVVLNLN